MISSAHRSHHTAKRPVHGHAQSQCQCRRFQPSRCERLGIAPTPWCRKFSTIAPLIPYRLPKGASDACCASVPQPLPLQDVAKVDKQTRRIWILTLEVEAKSCSLALRRLQVIQTFWSEAKRRCCVATRIRDQAPVVTSVQS